MYDSAHKIVAAYDVTEHLTLGAGANLIRSKLGTFSVGSQTEDVATGVSLDLGLLYDRTFEMGLGTLSPSFGWSLTDFGPMMEFEGSEQKDPLTMMMRGGISLQATSNRTVLNRPLATVGLHGNLSKMRVGGEFEDGSISYYGPIEALVKTWKPLDVVGTVNGEPGQAIETLSVVEQFITHRGLELSLMEILYVRWGAFHEDDYNGGRQYATRGWGIDLYYLALDYSITTTDERNPLRDQSFWRLTASVPLETLPDNFWPALLDIVR